MSTFILLIFAILLGSVVAPEFNPFLELVCVDCKEDCGVRSTGSSCLSLDRSRTFSVANMTRYTMDHYNHLKKCIPRDEHLSEPKPDFCCAWSPELGCQMIKRLSGLQRTCDSCKELTQDSPEIELCPCKAAHAKLCTGLLIIAITVLQLGIIDPSNWAL
ncbi:uncharacterized protein LOC111081078 [Drosophila obscura]|uniref:uncharacterized protein LOC111081078 n=1 Tax=Drosophila obscura TaxID=7282 RepID=UPI000BA0A16C|nr:uncharacterized protein LOC111081078 [Drosophila obscura]